MIVIIVHTLLGGKIQNLVSYRFDREYISFLILVVILQIVLSLGIVIVLDRFKRWKYSIMKIN